MTDIFTIPANSQAYLTGIRDSADGKIDVIDLVYDYNGGNGNNILTIPGNSVAYLTARRAALDGKFDVTEFIYQQGEAAYDLLTGLWAYWKMDEASGTREDSSGTDSADFHDLSEVNGPIGYVSGKVGNAAYLETGSNHQLRWEGTNWDPTDPFTAAFWWYPASDVNGNGVEFNSNFGIYTVYDSGDSKYYVWAYTDYLYVQGSVDVNPAEWHLILLVYDGTTLYLYVDNSLADSDTGTAFDGPYSTTYFDAYGADSYVDEAAIWENRALNAEERAYLWNDGNGRTLF